MSINFLLNWLWLLILLVLYSSVTRNWKLSKMLKLPIWLLLISFRLEVDLIWWALYNELEILIGVLTIDRFSNLTKMFSPTYVVLLKKKKIHWWMNYFFPTRRSILSSWDTNFVWICLYLSSCERNFEYHWFILLRFPMSSSRDFKSHGNCFIY